VRARAIFAGTGCDAVRQGARCEGRAVLYTDRIIPRGVYSRHVDSSCRTAGGRAPSLPRRSHSSSAGPWYSLRGDVDLERADRAAAVTACAAVESTPPGCGCQCEPALQVGADRLLRNGPAASAGGVVMAKGVDGARET
jgi:hypothetical protein